MKKNDDLLRLAFGELSAENARAVEARVDGDASAMAELQALRDLSAGLQNLPPPPPDNLSAERLRAAILDRDLRARRPSPFGWAWAPLAVAAVAAFVLVSRPHPQAEPTVVALSDAERLDAPAPLRFDVGDAFRAPTFSVPSTTDADRAVAVRTTPPPVERRARAKTRRKVVVPETRADDALFALNSHGDEDDTVVLAVDREPQTMAAPASTVVPDGSPATKDGNVREPSAARASDTVVIVSPKRDLDTGANAATETEATNVLVGG